MMRGQSSGTMRPPSGASPSRRMSVKVWEAAWPRVETYFTNRWGQTPFSSQELLQPDAYHRRGNRGERLHPPNGGVDVPLRDHVREDHHVDLVLALARLLLEDGVDGDVELR